MPSRLWFISKTPPLIDLGGGGGEAALDFRGINTVNAGSVSNISITTPSETVDGDLLFAFICTKISLQDFGHHPDDVFAGWAKLDYMREYKAGQDHQYTIFWKLADGSDAAGGASHQFNLRDTTNSSDYTFNTDGFIVAFSGVQDPATDLDFLYQWDASEMTGTGTDVLVADIDLREAPEGSGLLVCFIVNDTVGTGITTPSEMTERLNDGGGVQRMVLATEVVNASTGSVGPKRFIQSSGVDYLGVAFILKPRDTGGRFEAIYTYPKFIDIPGRTVTSFNAGSVTMAPPSGTQVGDLLLLVLGRDAGGYTGGAADTVDPSSQGWTTLYSHVLFVKQGLAVWWKRATAEDASTAPDEVLLDWSSHGGGQSGTAYMYRISGVTYDTADSFIGFLGNNLQNTGNPAIEPIITTPFDNCLLFKTFVGRYGSGTRRLDTEARGVGKIVDVANKDGASGITIMNMVEGAPIAGVYGGAGIQMQGSWFYDFVTIYIAKEAV